MTRPDEQKCQIHPDRFLVMKSRRYDVGGLVTSEATETYWACQEPGCTYRNPPAPDGPTVLE